LTAVSTTSFSTCSPAGMAAAAAGRACRRPRSTVPTEAPDNGLTKAIAPATSSADTSRPIGWRALSAARSAAGSAVRLQPVHPWRVRCARGDAVDPDALAEVDRRHGQRQRVHRALAGRIQHPLLQPGSRDDRARVDDRRRVVASSRTRPSSATADSVIRSSSRTRGATRSVALTDFGSSSEKMDHPP
jgi:hypothetical protein